jgi:Cysteine rich repeat
MVDTLKPALALAASMAAVLFTVATPALSQAPTDAQRSAIRSECRSDYEAHCASVPPGGMASLQCLQKNMSSLSSGCQTAVRAVEAPAEPKTETKTETKTEPKTESAPAAATAKPATGTTAPAASKTEAGTKPAASTAAKKPSSAQIAAIRSSCRSDYQKSCAGVPTGGAAALNCLEKNKASLSPSCQKAVNAAGGGAPTAETGGAPAAAATASPAPAAAAAARGIIRFEVGMRWRCSRAVRKCCARRRPHPAMPGDAGSLAFPRMQGRSGPVRCPVNCPPVEGSSPANQTVDP